MQLFSHVRDSSKSLSVEIGDIGMIWDNYFPDMEFSDKDPKIKLVKDLASFFFSEPSAERLLLSQVYHPPPPDFNLFE